MSIDFALVLTSDMLWVAIKIAAPILGLTMAVGLLISLFQVVTQLQEMTLTFIPKLAVAVFVLIAFGGWMLTTLVDYARTLIASIPNLL
ncbi:MULTISPECIES: flagellar biosynthetic protein FliQ [Gynuella]|uniref:Flagellar biosynthesis pathway, component FliQ n=1 Tax=Gynuella sunshinyii YC6258 TaxID=1445510 RepID=A0A0C5VHD8_9GAMM|nr:flagellar biosynthetic protein FliQ [Gynuella sunshinyii]AJQ92728.1 flagellar biosynthesis pathway, component FliQ [Gynuella sunshinyii YC6258]